MNQSTHDGYGMKDDDSLQQGLQKFNTFFCLQLCHILFSRAEHLSKKRGSAFKMHFVWKQQNVTINEYVLVFNNRFYEEIVLRVFDITFLKALCHYIVPSVVNKQRVD